MSVLTVTTTAHSGVAPQRSHPELYDVVTFALAVVAVIFVRRALRVRFAKRRQPDDTPKD